AAGYDGVLLPLPAIHVAAGLLAQTMRLVNQRAQHRQRIGYDVLILAVGREGVRARRVQLDPVRTMSDLRAHSGARVFDRSNYGAGERVVGLRGVGGLVSPHDP